MYRIKKIVTAIGVVFITIQFIPPAGNKSGKVLVADISKMVSISDSVKAVLKNACFDCHSNNTNNKWYSNLQPIGWLINSHITQGKAALNFSEFGGYSTRRQLSKLTGIANSIKDDTMPLWSYKLMHKKARLTKDEKRLIIAWARQSTDSLSAKK